MTKRFVIVGEAPADRTTSRELADRVILEAIDWLADHPSLLNEQRSWIEQLPDGISVTWKDLSGVAKKLGIRMHGHFDGRPGEPDAAAARKAVAVILRQLSNVDAVVLIRDADKQGERLMGLEQARKAFANDVTVVLGLAVPERESWVVVGFDPDPRDVSEGERLEVVKKRIGFDPRLRSHELTGTRDAKQVLRDLTNGNVDRQRNCWTETPLKVLRDRGQKNGLADYLQEVEQRLVPLIVGDSSRAARTR